MTTTLPAVWQQTPPAGTGSADYQPQSRAEQVAHDFLFSYRNQDTRKNYAAGLKRWFGFCLKAGIDRTPGRRLNRNDIQQMVKRYARWTGITQRISPHSFRHTFITQSLNAGASARDVQAAAGHKDGRMTSYYDHGNQNRGREATHALTAYIAEML